MTRWAVAVRSPTSGERVWVSPLGRLVHEGWRAAAFGNAARAWELAGRRPKWEEVEVVEAPPHEPPRASHLTAAQMATPAPDGRAPASRPSDWAASSSKGVQQRTKADGSTVFRARSQGKVSPTFETLEDARSWQP